MRRINDTFFALSEEKNGNFKKRIHKLGQSGGPFNFITRLHRR